MTRGLALGLCRRVSHWAGAGAPGWLPPAADGEAAFCCSEQSTHGSRRQWPASQAWRFLLTETQASIRKVSHWHMSQTGWQVDFEHRLGEEEQAATTMSREMVVHRNGCCVQPPFAPMELDLSRLSCPGLFGTCWSSAQSAKVLVDGVPQHRGKWGSCALPLGQHSGVRRKQHASKTQYQSLLA